MIELNESLFQNIQEILWLLDENDNVIMSTTMALEFEKKYQLDLNKIMDISRGRGCALHTTQKKCLNCALDERVSPSGFPFILFDCHQQSQEFWGKVESNEKQSLLEINLVNSITTEKSLFYYLDNAREAERKKIAQDLHDGVAQSVYSLMLETRSLKWLPHEAKEDKLKDIDRHFSEVLSEIKNMASELRPMSIDTFGLIQALEQFVDRTVEMTGFEIIMSVHGEEQLIKESVRIVIYRIIQEAVNNAMKYSGRNQMNLELFYEEEKLLIDMSDRGIGFDMEVVGLGFGLINMRERAHSFGGELLIFSRQEHGTTIQLQVPLKEGRGL